MARKQTFLSKSQRKKEGTHCPVCEAELQHVKSVKAFKGPNGAWKFRSLNTPLCKCNEKEIYS